MSNAIDETYRSAASVNAEEKYWYDVQAEADAQASELRLSVIEHLDRQHAGAVADQASHACCGLDPAVCPHARYEQALWDALEIVRNIEARA